MAHPRHPVAKEFEINRIPFCVHEVAVWSATNHRQEIVHTFYYVRYNKEFNTNMSLILTDDGFGPVREKRELIKSAKFDTPEEAEAATREAWAWDQLGAE